MAEIRQPDYWTKIRIDVERAYWYEFEKYNEAEEIVTGIAKAILVDPEFVCDAIGGYEGFPINLGHWGNFGVRGGNRIQFIRTEKPIIAIARAVADKFFPDLEWEFHTTCGGEIRAFVTARK